MIARLGLCLVILHLGTVVMCAGYFDYHRRAQTIYHDIMELRLIGAQTALAQLKRDEPDNLVVYHLENYVDFFTVYVSEDEQVYRRLLPNRDRRLDLVKAGDEDSPYYLYIQAEIRLHWALMRFRFEQFLPAFQDINRAHKLLLRNEKRFPNFLPNKKDLGILHAAVGTVPDNFRWAVELLSSLEGTIEQGKREIEQVLAATSPDDFVFRQETQVLYAFLLLHLDGRPDAAWRALGDAKLDASRTPLHAFVLANIAMRTGRNEQAIRWITAAPESEAFFTFPYLDYMLGVAKLRKLDTSGRKDLQRFLRNTRGRHYIKEAYQKLAWADLLDGDQAGYQQQIALVKTRGAGSAGGDKNALLEANSSSPVHPVLLKARLLFDGGYYDRAYNQLASFREVHFGLFIHRLEFLYRKGRILHGQKRYEQALQQYNNTITQGHNHPAFYACNAALQAGLVEEIRGRKAAAIVYFNTCLDLKPTDYRTGLHQQAKAGLKRMGE